MTADEWLEVHRLLDLALDAAPDAQAALLDAHCAGRPGLRAEVERLLRACQDGEDFLNQPAAEWGWPLVIASPSDEDASPGTMVGRYRLVRELGRGGMGVVYLAERDDFHKRVALKLVRDGLHADHAIRRFLEERQILAALEHPGIARLLDGGIGPKGAPYLVMEYVDGVPIDRFCDAHALGLTARLDLFSRVCDAVHYAHRNLVVHRDLKPSNLLVTASGEPKLLDFGIAKLLAPGGVDPGARFTGGTMTPEYASPEQLLGGGISTSSDVYSLGVLLYRLLTGSTPRAGAHGISDGEPVAPSAAIASPELHPRLQRKLRGDLDAIVLTALQREPEQRYPSAEALALDLRRYLGGFPVTVGPGGWRYRARKFVRRHRGGTAASAAAMLLILGSSGAAVVQAARLRVETVRAAGDRDRAEATVGFLTDLFLASNREASAGPEVSARDLLDRGRARIERNTALDPATRAELLSAVGHAYRGLGAYTEAERMFAAALASRRGVANGADPRIADHLYNLAYMQREQGRYAEAEPLFRESLALRRRNPDDHLGLAVALNGLAFHLRGEGSLEEAESLYREALAVGRQWLGPRQEQLAASLNGLGSTLMHRGNLAESERYLREALAMNRAIYGSDAPHTTVSLYNLGYLLHMRGELAEAEPLMRESVEMARRLQGPRHPMVAVDLMGLANVLRDRGRPGEAEPIYREALSIQTEALPPRHERTATTMVALGRLLADQKRVAEAEPLLREALSIRRHQLVPGSWQIAQAESELGGVLATQGHADARRLLQDGLAGLLRARGQPDMYVLRAQELVRRSGVASASEP